MIETPLLLQNNDTNQTIIGEVHAVFVVWRAQPDDRVEDREAPGLGKLLCEENRARDSKTGRKQNIFGCSIARSRPSLMRFYSPSNVLIISLDLIVARCSGRESTRLLASCAAIILHASIRKSSRPPAYKYYSFALRSNRSRRK